MQTTLQIRTRKKYEVVDLTAHVTAVVAGAGLAEGLCTVFVRHATAAIVINENADPGFRPDIVAALDKLFPEGVWEHDKVDDNGAAHLKAAFLGPSETIPVQAGRLRLGTWQASPWWSATGRESEKSWSTCADEPGADPGPPRPWGAVQLQPARW